MWKILQFLSFIKYIPNFIHNQYMEKPQIARGPTTRWTASLPQPLSVCVSHSTRCLENFLIKSILLLFLICFLLQMQPQIFSHRVLNCSLSQELAMPLPFSFPLWHSTVGLTQMLTTTPSTYENCRKRENHSSLMELYSED